MTENLSDKLYRDPKGRKRRTGAKSLYGRGFDPTAEELAVYADWIKGATYAEAAEKYGYKSRSTAHDVCKKVNAWLTPQFVQDIRQLRCEHTQRLLHIYSEAMAAFERSKRDKVQFEHERGEDGKLRLSKVKREPQAGSPTLLTEARAALADIRKLLGVDAPLKVSHEHSGELRVAGKSPDEARAALAEKLDQSRQRLLAISTN